MQIRAYRLEDLALMEPRAEEAPIAELERENNAVRIHGPAWTAWMGPYHTTPVAAAGIVMLREGVGQAWFRGTPAIERRPGWLGVMVALAIKRRIEKEIVERKIRHLQAMTASCRMYNVKFIEWLGFEYVGTLHRAGPMGEDEMLFEIVPGTTPPNPLSINVEGGPDKKSPAESPALSGVERAGATCGGFSDGGKPVLPSDFP